MISKSLVTNIDALVKSEALRPQGGEHPGKEFVYFITPLAGALPVIFLRSEPFWGFG